MGNMLCGFNFFDNQDLADAFVASCKKGELGNMEMLIGSRGNTWLVNMPSTAGEPPIVAAIWCNRFDSTNYLLSFKSLNVNCYNHFGITPLIACCQNKGRGWASIAKRLIQDFGAFVNDQDVENKWSGMHYCAYSNDLATARVLLMARADVNVIDYYKHSPLFVASSNGHVEMVDLLLEYHASTDIVDAEGYTAEKHALNENTKRIFQKHSAKRDSKSAKKETPYFSFFSIDSSSSSKV